ncbi:MAG TPA: c-type cytochrome [Acidobacteriota bacterium]|nr:c-type cytochrome [Acidobacteriota bacterium]
MRKFAVWFLVSAWASLFLIDAALSEVSPPLEDEAEIKRQIRKGKRVFRLHCQLCHGEEGEHPDELFSLADNKWRHGDSLEDIEQNVAQGILGTAMLPFQGRLSEEDIKNVSRYVYSFIEEKKEE